MEQNQNPTTENISYIATLGTPQQTQSIIPEQFKPTKRFVAILSIIILSVVVLGLFQFPYGSLISGNTDISIDIGYPSPFLQFSLSDPNQFPLNITNFLIDIIIYIILSYAIDIIIGLMLGIRTKEPEVTTVQTFKNQSMSLADNATKKIMQKNIPQAPNPPITQPNNTTTQQV